MRGAVRGSFVRCFPFVRTWRFVVYFHCVLFSILDLKHPTHRCVVRARLVHGDGSSFSPKFKDGKMGGLVLTYSGIEEVVISPGESEVVTTGVAYDIPAGFYGVIQGLYMNSAVYAVYAISDVVGSDYKDEVSVHLVNRHRSRGYTVWPGDEIGVLIIKRSVEVLCIPVVEGDEDRSRRSRGYSAYPDETDGNPRPLSANNSISLCTVT